MTNSEEANKYYKLINEYIDIYLDKWKVDPKNLKRYLNTNRISNFLKRKGLNEIKNIGRVINDVIEDRISLEKDKIISFESFKFFESNEYQISDISECIHKGINKSNIEHEKIIADHYDTSLSQIDIIDSDKHKFKIKDGDLLVIYNEEEINIIKENIKEWAMEKAYSEHIKLNIGGKEIKISIKESIDKEKLEESISKEIINVKSIIGSILKCQRIVSEEKYFLGIL